MIFEVDDDQTTDYDRDRPREEVEFASAKAYLQTSSSFSGDNLYDHLTDVLNKILAERPENVIDFFEEYSRKVKEKRFKPMTDHLEDIYVPPGKYALAKNLLPLFKPIQPAEPSTQDPEDLDLADMSRNDMLQLLYYFEHAGIGLPRYEMFYLTLAMRQLVHTEPIISIRFWGKIFGLYKNYFVIEAELKEEEIMKRNEQLQDAEVAVLEAQDVPQPPPVEDLALENIARDQELVGEGGATSKVPRKLPPAPTMNYEPPPEAPSEFTGVGVNKKVFYVCNEIGDKWIELPNVTPKQIQVARKIYVSFTGNLDQEIITYPEFPGTERDYLRVQIARISAGTQISPLGFYTFKAGGAEEEEEEEEEEEAAPEGPKTTYKENPKYEPVPIKDLVDGSMAFWVHHTMYILPQGRTTWWNPNPMPETEAMDEELGEGEEEKPRVAGPEPETGPPLLTPCSEDASLEAVPAWSVRCSSNILEEYAIAIVRSNLWPGAYCFSNQGKTFQNIYLGYGLKYLAHNFSPDPLPPVQQDYPVGPEIMEITDPTGAEEEAWRIAHLPKPPVIKPMVGEGGEEAEEEDEDEDEDD